MKIKEVKREKPGKMEKKKNSRSLNEEEIIGVVIGV